MTTLISFLGKSRADASAGYRVANYRFAPNFARKVPFFGMALLEYAKPERLILVGTAGSMWDVFFDHQHTDDEATLVVSDAVDRATVTPELLRTHEEILTQRLGMPVQCLLIPYARDSAEQAAVLSELAVVLQPSEEIILDVTHGFRHLPMLALVAARYLTHVRGVRVQELYYGALEMTNAETGETPCCDWAQCCKCSIGSKPWRATAKAVTMVCSLTSSRPMACQPATQINWPKAPISSVAATRYRHDRH